LLTNHEGISDNTKNWISAFAGMTAKTENPGLQNTSMYFAFQAALRAFNFAPGKISAALTLAMTIKKQKKNNLNR
jgi:hypothetical protein